MAGESYENIVVGCGGIGSAATYWLAREGQGEVLGLEQFELDHDKGESFGPSRIIRLSYHNPTYTALTRSAYEAWNEIESASGLQLVQKTGGLDLDSDHEYLDGVARSMDAADIPYERLSSGQVMDRWPQFNVPKDMAGLYQDDSGIVDASKSVIAHVELARDMGANILPNSPVRSIEIMDKNNVEVSTDNNTYEAKKVIIASGPWTNQVLESAGVQLPLIVTQEQAMFYDTPEVDEFLPGKFPIWLWHRGDSERYYGFPAHGEPPATKAGIHMGGQEVTAETRSFEPDQRITQSLQAMLEEHIPDFIGPVRKAKTCLYTLAPDRDFIVDTLPDNPNIAVVVGSGHAYKFAGFLGRTLARMVTTGITSRSMSSFSLGRPALTDPNYAPDDLHFGSQVKPES